VVHGVRHNQVKGGDHIVLDHVRAAEVALKHLFSWAIATSPSSKDRKFSSDTKFVGPTSRRLAANCISRFSRAHSQLQGDSPSPHLYEATRRLLASHKPFTALSPLTTFRHGAIRPLRRPSCRVPTMFPWWASRHPERPYRNPALHGAQPCAKWEGLPPKLCCAASRVPDPIPTRRNMVEPN